MLHVNDKILAALDEYHERSLMMQEWLYDRTLSGHPEEIKAKVDDDLIFHVPIYDNLDRKYAAFSSFPEALHAREKDPKGYGKKFDYHEVNSVDLTALLYLFRLCGSGINYKPGSHGFGNFWIVKQILAERYTAHEWLEELPTEKFSDNRGYLLPQFKIGLRNYIIKHSLDLVYELSEFIDKKPRDIKEVVDEGNQILRECGFQRQTFVLSAFAADLAEYFPKKVNRLSMIYAGSNAKKCIKALFNKCSEEEAIQFLADRYQAPPYSVEDSRLCDPVRYFLEFQSAYHVTHNNGITYKNNSILKKLMTWTEFLAFQSQLQA